MGLALSGSPGEQVNQLEISLKSSNTHIGKTLLPLKTSGMVIVNSEWLFWEQFKSQYIYLITTLYFPFGNNDDAPMSLKYTDPDFIDHYLAIFPLINTAPMMDLIRIYTLGDVLMPYGYDILSYVISISDYSGALDSYYEVYNAGTDIFKSASTNDLNLTCDNLSDGVDNTFCTISLRPSNKIQPYSVILVNLQGMYVSTNSCMF